MKSESSSNEAQIQMFSDHELLTAPSLKQTIDAIVARRGATAPSRSLLVGISGIDGSGKGYIAAALEKEIAATGLRVANVNADGWLNLPQLRFNSDDPAEHFYQHALRLDAMFSQLLLPLRERRSLQLEMDFVAETTITSTKRRLEFHDVDVILAEGIFLFKPEFRAAFDLRIWIDCSFETALKRALRRGQEGLPPGETIHMYETIFFPAQQIHLQRDNPRAAANLVIANDVIPVRVENELI